jgi:geranylgeranyl diphosphate synthase, type II
MGQPSLESFSHSVIQRVDAHLKKLLDPEQGHDAERLFQAMSYATLNGGKRIRPLLCFASAHVFDEFALENDAILTSACALEMIHAYSLIHDDLPAMDDDDLRRGNPTVHKQFDEATAILAGDALQALAFETLTQAKNIQPPQKLTLVRLLAEGAGANGMAGGQMIDLQAVGEKLDLDALMQMHSMKTGALICASVLMGASAAGCEDRNQLATLRIYAENIGLAFQIQDDILDCIADTNTLGKQKGADASRNKPNYVSILGIDGAKGKLQEAHSQAKDALRGFTNSSFLAQLADYIVERTH